MKLHSNKNLAIDIDHNAQSFVSLITENADLIEPRRENATLLLSDTLENIPNGFKLVLIKSEAANTMAQSGVNLVKLDDSLSYLKEGDIIKFDPSKLSISVLYRKGANSNSFLLTERCNSFCLMCSQPPRDIDDSYRVNDILNSIPLIDKASHEIGLTGGEPTLLGNDFFRIIHSLKRHLPQTSVHILSNGRNFKNASLAEAVKDINHPDLMFGIPIYSDIPHIHDFVVQADGAYDETILGILNLKKHKQRVEIRVVIHKQTFERLPQLANFIARNLLFVDHVALMGLEIMGFTRANLDELWVDPTEYQEQLSEAVNILARARIRTSIYNLQLCLLPKALWPYAVKSISDWKNDYVSECSLCSVKNRCGGFFSSSIHKRSDNISAILEE